MGQVKKSLEHVPCTTLVTLLIIFFAHHCMYVSTGGYITEKFMVDNENKEAIVKKNIGRL